jgi:hypothetical protein
MCTTCRICEVPYCFDNQYLDGGGKNHVARIMLVARIIRFSEVPHCLMISAWMLLVLQLSNPDVMAKVGEQHCGPAGRSKNKTPLQNDSGCLITHHMPHSVSKLLRTHRSLRFVS